MTNEKKRIVVIDYGMGNLKSVVNALLFLGSDAKISDKKSDLIDADAFILPGVGAFGEAMKNLSGLQIIDTLNNEVVKRKKPLLGICLGMQLLAESSDEFGSTRGLGWIPGHVKRLDVGTDLRLPHVGWNTIQVTKPDPLYTDIQGELVYYFVHTFHFDCDDRYISAKCHYGRDFAASVQKDNILATQFHPEKSQDKGLRLLRNYLNFIEAYYQKGAVHA